MRELVVTAGRRGVPQEVASLKAVLFPNQKSAQHRVPPTQPSPPPQHQPITKRGKAEAQQPAKEAQTQIISN